MIRNSVIPAKAGIQSVRVASYLLDSRLRGNDECGALNAFAPQEKHEP